MRVLIRQMNAGSALPRWRTFEAMLCELLEELGCEVQTLTLDCEFPADPKGFDRYFYAHATCNQVSHANFYFKEMHLRWIFTIDKQGWGAEHSAARSMSFDDVDADSAVEYCDALATQFLSTGCSKHQQPDLESSGPPPGPYILVPLQTPTDYVVRTHSPLSVVDFVHLVSDWADARKQRVVFKMHPFGRDEAIVEAINRRTAASPFVLARQDNIHSLISHSCGVLVINSGVGFESLIHGKPVATFGNCDYKCATFRASAHRLDEALSYFLEYSTEQRVSAARFVYHYVWRHAYNVAPDAREQSRSRLRDYLQANLLG